MAELGRLITALVTPFDEQGNVDYEQAKRLVRALLKSGSDGFLVGGTTGEAPTLSNGEKLRLYAELKSTVGEEASIVAGTGNYSTWESIELSKQAEEVGVDGLLLTVPYYNKPPQEGIYQHMKTIAGSTHLPCIMYNIPGAHRRQYVGGDRYPPQPHRQHCGRQRGHQRFRTGGPGSGRGNPRLSLLERQRWGHVPRCSPLAATAWSA